MTTNLNPPENRAVRLSFEFFPPKSDAQAEALHKAAARLARFRPDFVSVTYGAGGTSRERSLDAVRTMLRAGLATAAHLTCVGASRAELAAVIDAYRGSGVDRFVALRGDPPGGLDQPYRSHPDGYSDTAGLVGALKAAGAREVAVSAYPERHPQSGDWSTEIDVLKRKVDAGADRAITQFFYDVDLFAAYLERVRAAGITIPVVPGLMPIVRFASVETFAGRCGASIPDSLKRRFVGLEDESDESRRVATAVGVEQVEGLRALGVASFHFYTLNRADLCEAICNTAFSGAAARQAAA